MEYQIEQRTMPAATLLAIRMDTTAEEIGSDLDEAFARLYDHLEYAGVPAADLPITLYYRLDDEAWDVEAAVPVPSPLDPPEGMSVRQLTTGRAAVTLHRGAYESLGQAYQALETWVEANACETRDAPYDRYLNDPEKVAPLDLLTEAIWPIC